jgi:glucosamine--fructose-6-phosphate aminotransferase (isomerizing)
MCGIIGIAGNGTSLNVPDAIFDGLRRLDYRGYDSSGITVADPATGSLQTIRALGHPEALRAKVRSLRGTTGIGHTRWATHGSPSEETAHPIDCDQLLLVHNGIIENAAEFLPAGTGGVDSKAIGALLTEGLRARKGVVSAVFAAVSRMRGSWAVAFVLKQDPGTIYAFRRNMPLILGSDGFVMGVTSDPVALPPVFDRTCDIPEDCVAVISSGYAAYVGKDGTAATPKFVPYRNNFAVSDKGTYADYFLKEICEQPDVLTRLMKTHLTDAGLVSEDLNGAAGLNLGKISNICIVGCGSSYHAGLAGKVYLESLLKLPVQVEVASEFQAGGFPLSPKTLFIAISQSGETADVLACVRQAAEARCQIVAFCNRQGTSLEKLATKTVSLECGPEVSVAATKSFTATILALHLFALACARQQGRISVRSQQDDVQELRRIPDDLRAFVRGERSHVEARTLSQARHVIFTGRGLGRVIVLEGALKFKELTYIPADGIGAGELKHGTLALVERGTPVIAVITDDDTAAKTAANLCEAETRAASICCYAGGDIIRSQHPGWSHRQLTGDGKFSRPYLAAAAMQLLTYDVAHTLGRNIDRPRNLAKSITVE